MDTVSGRPDDDEGIEALLPDYVTGRLDADGVAKVDAWIAADPGPRGERVAFDRAIAESVARRVHELPADVGLDRLLAAAAAESGRPAPPARARPAAGPDRVGGALDRLWRWFAGPRLAWALGAVVLVQAGLIGTMIQPGGAPSVEYRSVGGAGPRPSVRVAFSPTATEAQIRAVLLEAGGALIAGPTQLGEYWVAPVAGGDPAALHRRLRDAPIVQAAAVDPVGPTPSR